MDLAEIVDAGNHERLLGYLTHRPVIVSRHDYYRVAILPPMSYRAPTQATTAYEDIEVVDFTAVWVLRDRGWNQCRVLATRAPLETLLKLRMQFRLPGENERQARYRVDAAEFHR